MKWSPFRQRRVFFCYSEQPDPDQDPNDIVRVAIALRKACYDVWYARDFGAVNFSDAAKAAIDRCDIFIFFASPRSVRGGSMCHDEVERYAKRRPGLEGMMVVEHRPGAIPADLHEALQRFAWLRGKGYLDELVAAELERRSRDLKLRWRFSRVAIAMPGVGFWLAVLVLWGLASAALVASVEAVGTRTTSSERFMCWFITAGALALLLVGWSAWLRRHMSRRKC